MPINKGVDKRNTMCTQEIQFSHYEKCCYAGKRRKLKALKLHDIRQTRKHKTTSVKSRLKIQKSRGATICWAEGEQQGVGRGSWCAER